MTQQEGKSLAVCSGIYRWRVRCNYPGNKYDRTDVLFGVGIIEMKNNDKMNYETAEKGRPLLMQNNGGLSQLP